MGILRKWKRLWLLLLVPAAWILTSAASAHPDFAEWYARTVYSRLSHTGNAVTSLAPFSVGELLVCILAVLLLFFLIRFCIRMVRRKGRRGETAAKFVINLVCFFGIVYFLFAVNCGINYHRLTFAQTCGLTVRPSSKVELIRLCDSLAKDADTYRTLVQTDSHSVAKLSGNYHETAEEAKKSFDCLHTEYPLLSAGYGAPKPVFFSRLMSRCNITGMFFPFTFEANVNTDVPEYTIPATMCHELTHLRGYMREEEANFIGYLACEKSSRADFRYSGTMLAFTYSYNALCGIDGSAAGNVYTKLSAGVRRDLAYNSAYWKQFEGPVANVSEKVNNSYLKANSQKNGVQSYGQMVDLLLALQRANEKGT